jgi:VWFA-related protein
MFRGLVVVAACAWLSFAAQAGQAPVGRLRMPQADAGAQQSAAGSAQTQSATQQSAGAATSQQTTTQQTTTQQKQSATPQTQTNGAASGQGASPDGQVFTLHKRVNEVYLVFTVTDKNGRYIRDLNAQDFELLDDGRAPETVKRFSQQTDLPLRVGLLIDTSSSVRSRFAFEQQSAIDFLLTILNRQYDQAFVMGFDAEHAITQGFTNNEGLLADGIHRLRANGGTAIYDALYSACRDQLLPLRSAGPVRKAIVLLSDGENNQGHILEPDEAIKECQRAETVVYTISTDNSPTRGHGDEVLQRIAEQTGGRAFVPKREDDLGKEFADVADELRSQYSIEYTPANFVTDGGFRSIYLVAMDRRYHVRASKGYFAPKE